MDQLLYFLRNCELLLLFSNGLATLEEAVSVRWFVHQSISWSFHQLLLHTLYILHILHNGLVLTFYMFLCFYQM